MMPIPADNDVGRYYNQNTRRFLSLGHGGGRLAIRRAVWAPGITNRDDAVEYVNSRIADELRELAGVDRVVDLGCGVGGSIAFLSRLIDAEYLGVTISAVQAELGRSLLAERGIARSTIIEADFTDCAFWEDQAQPFDAACAVESLIHVPQLTSHLETIADGLRPGGKLIVVDDMLASSASEGSRPRREQRRLRRFRAGWHAHGLSSMQAFIDAAEQAGLKLQRNEDLTAYLELDRPRDLFARAFIALVGWLPIRAGWFENLLGGNALQLALKNRTIEYRLLVFHRSI